MYKKVFLFLFLCLFFIPIPVFANNPAKMYYFYSDTCSHCKQAEIFFDEIANRYPDLQIISYEVTHNQENYELMLEVLDRLNISARGTPLIVLGSRGTVGFNDSMRLVIEDNILYARYNEVRDIVGEIQGTSSYFEEKISDTDIYADLPVWNQANLKQDNMTLMTFDLGLFSGFSVLLVTIIFSFVFLFIFHISQFVLLPFWISLLILFLAFLTNGNLIHFSSSAKFVFGILSLFFFLFAIVCYKYRKQSWIMKYFSFETIPIQKGTSLFFIVFACLLSCLFFATQNENVLLYQRLLVLRSITGFSSYIYAFCFLFSFFLPNLLLYGLFFVVSKKRKMVSKG